jgi:hypothetical protein
MRTLKSRIASTRDLDGGGGYSFQNTIPFQVKKPEHGKKVFFSSKVRRVFKRGQNGLRAIGEAVNIAKLTAMSFEFKKNTPGFPKKPKSVSKRIRKGIFRDMALYVLTLIERENCNDCPILDSCYGRNMPHAVRMDPKAKGFKKAMLADIDVLSKRYPKGYVIRLHELGDFFSVDYVKFWEGLLIDNPRLNIFGYSHQSGAIGAEIDRVFIDHPGRFNIMDSDGAHGTGIRPTATVSEDALEGATDCPQQTKRTPSCITCGLCMNGRTNVRFYPH